MSQLLCRLALLVIAAAAFGGSAGAQVFGGSAGAQVQSQRQEPILQANRIPAYADLSRRTRLPGQLPAWVTPARDAGSAPSDAEVALTFVLARSPEQQAAFDQLLADQQNPASASYHHWLTPQQIGDRFGPTEQDVDAIVAWLRASGLQVKPVAPSRLFLDAYGPASAASTALGTSFRLYNSLGKSHLSATGDPSIPTAFSAVISSISGLTEFELFPQSHLSAPDAMLVPTLSGARPQYTNGGGSHYLFPSDFAVIFDINPLYNAGINGAGQRVAIVGRSQINPSDIASFERLAALPSNAPNIVVASTGSDPGLVTGDEGESDLDLERVLGVAPGVTADFVISGSANGFNGIYVAAQYEVQTLLDPVLSLSYGACERTSGASGVALWSNLFSQAAAEGISVFVSSGDSGAAFCDTQFATPPATQFLSVNYICSNPYTTCVGGTELADTASPATFWSSTNGAGGVSALGYIPEGGWNDPFNTTTKTYVARASTGGASTFVSKPAYQAGIGVPADGFRDVPDVSFPASSHDGYFGCEADITTFNGDCASGGGVVFSGTSAAAPGWAGVTALLNQKAGVSQGNLNPTLYRLASNPANGAFHDVTPATTGLGSCDVSLPSLCNNSVPSPTALTGGQIGYPVQTGYDQVTGWGSADVTRFVTAAVIPYELTSIVLTASSLSVQPGQSIAVSAAITKSGSGTLTGTVQLLANGAVFGPALALVNGASSVSTSIAFPAAGTYSLVAMYSGNSLFVPATSAPLLLQVGPALTLLANPSSLAFAAGASTGNSSTLTYTSANGLAGPVTAVCSVSFSAGTPAVAPTCSVTGATLTAGGTATGTLTIGSTAPSAGEAPFFAGTPLMAPLSRSGGCVWTFGSFVALILLINPRRRRRLTSSLPRLAALLLLATGLATLAGCGAGVFSNNRVVGTTTGSYVVTVTANSGPATASISVPLTIQ